MQRSIHTSYSQSILRKTIGGGIGWIKVEKIDRLDIFGIWVMNFKVVTELETPNQYHIVFSYSILDGLECYK
ncbi:hypothetical protein DMA11_13115 [Marinilabiliaceae bacterium JC017]|nr:hypothetical protein DMA11_13115 [Marinilabiliaceae bacterium JC017]